MDILNELCKYKDEKYADFQAKLTPTVDKSLFIGVRVPDCRKLAGEILKEGGYDEFLASLPHKYYDENMLHGLCISGLRDYDRVIRELDRFLPYVDNWAVCDIMSPKVFKKNRDKLIPEIKKWVKSEHLYTKRFAVEMIMSHFLDEDFKAEYLEIPAQIISNEYYMNMMTAWFFATALAKRWDETIIYLTEKRLSPWVHNKTIQKARESYRITDEQKEYLLTLKIQEK